MTRRLEKKKWRAKFKCPKCGRDPYKGVCQNVSCQRYLTGQRLRFKAGSVVVVKGYEKQGKRTVELVYSDIDGGRRLDEPVEGHVSWNVSDLRLATSLRRR